MTALQYMQKQLEKHKVNLHRAIAKKSPDEEVDNIKNKISYYEAAVDALRKCGDNQ